MILFATAHGEWQYRVSAQGGSIMLAVCISLDDSGTEDLATCQVWQSDEYEILDNSKMNIFYQLSNINPTEIANTDENRNHFMPTIGSSIDNFQNLQ